MTTTVELVKKVCLIGDPGVGKTSLIRRYVLDQFSDTYLSTIGAKVTKKEKLIDMRDRDLRIHLILVIWDVAGQKEYKLFHEMYLNGMEGVLAVADLTRMNTFDSLKAAIQMADRTAMKIPMIFLLNKCDMAELSSIDLKDVRTLASQRNIPVLATSAKTGMNVEMAFDQLSQMVIEAWIKKKYKQ